MNERGVRWFHYTKTKMISKIITITGYQATKPHYDDLGESGGDDDEERSVYLRN